jgi:hypothetical protein
MALNRETRYTARLEPGLRLSLTSIFIAALFCDALDPQIMPFFEKAVRVFRSQSGIPQVSYSYHYNMWFSNLLDPNSPLGDMFRYVFIEMLNHNNSDCWLNGKAVDSKPKDYRFDSCTVLFLAFSAAASKNLPYLRLRCGPRSKSQGEKQCAIPSLMIAGRYPNEAAT